MSILGRTEPTHKPGAYVSRGISLYEVLYYEKGTDGKSELWVEDVLTLSRFALDDEEQADIELVRRAPAQPELA